MGGVSWQKAADDAADAALYAEAIAEYQRTGDRWPVRTVEELAAQWGIDPTGDATA